MGLILKRTTNLVANAKYKIKRFISVSYSSSSIVRDVPPATGGIALPHALWYPPDLKRCANISSNSLMLAVEHLCRSGTRHYSVISTEGGSFKVVQDTPSNFSILLRATEYDALYAKGNYDILASCNKWILLKCNRVLHGDPYEVLWNPTTNEMRPLPFFAWPPLYRGFIHLEVNWNCDSIGFDPVSEDYKVVRYGLSTDPCAEVQEEAQVHAALFSLETGSWKRIPYPYRPYMRPFTCTCVHINGISYWIAWNVGVPARLNSAIVSFDFTNENFPDLIPLPESDRLIHISCVDIVEFRGSLAAIVSKYQDSDESVVKEPFEFEIWVWNGGWSLDSTCTVPLLDDDVCVDRVLGLYMNDKALFLGSNGSLLLYDCHTQVLKDLGIRDEVRYGMMVYPYVQST